MSTSNHFYAATPEEIEKRRKAFVRKWRAKHRAVADGLEEAGDRLFSFTRLPAALPSADTAAVLFCALLAAAQINLRKIDGWQAMASVAIAQPMTAPLEQIPLQPGDASPLFPTQFATRHSPFFPSLLKSLAPSS